MRYLYDDMDIIANRIKEESKKVVIYGAGMIGKVIVPYYIEEYDLHDNILFFVDGDSRKQGETISIGEKEYRIVEPEKLKKIDKETILLVTNSSFMAVIQMLDEMEELEEIESYIIPVILADSVPKETMCPAKIRHKHRLIPKKIHYCWFSGNPMPDYLKRCIDSWYRFCPDYEIICWNEDNYDVNKNLYMKQAYEAKKWGFIPDIARLDILYQHGGIYLDTDVELIRNLDDLLNQSAFAGVEKWGNINMGGCSGAVAHHPIIKKMLDFRKEESFLLKDGTLNLTTCGFYETLPLMELGMKPNNKIQYLEDFTIYSSDFFHPYDYMSGETHITQNTYSIHHFNGGWLNKDKREEREKTTQMYQQILGRMRSVGNDKQ